MGLRVVHVCPGRFHHFDLARQLAAHGCLTRFFTGYPRRKLQGEGLPEGRVSTYPWLMTPYMALLKWGRLQDLWQQPMLRLVQEGLDAHVARNLPDCDVLLALSGSGLRSGRVAQRRGIRFVCDRGSSHIRHQDAALREEFARWGQEYSGIDRKLLEREEAEYAVADAIIVPSQFTLQSFVEQGVPREKLRKVPYGVDTRLFYPVSQPNPDDFEVLFVGQVCFRKGVPDLLEAFGRLDHPRKRLRVVGGVAPETKRYLQQQPPKGGVDFLGHAPQPRLRDFMSRAHVMVLPSIEEGLALVQAQALACGCPVVATPNTGAEDLFEPGTEGFIIPPRRPQLIAERLQELADNPELQREMSAAALHRASLLRGWDGYGDRMMEVLSDLVRSDSVSRRGSVTEVVGGANHKEHGR